MRQLLALAAAVLLLVPAASAQNLISLDGVDGLVDGNIQIGSHLTFNLRVQIDAGISGGALTAHQNAFVIYSEDGAMWEVVPDVEHVDTPYVTPIGRMHEPWGQAWFPIFRAINYFNIDGQGADTIAFGGTGLVGGAPAGFDGVVWTIDMDILNDPGLHNTTLCFDSVAETPPRQIWKWVSNASENLFPDFAGAQCWTVVDPNATQNTAPEITPTADKEVAENELLAFQVTASDADEDPLEFSIVGKPATATFVDNTDGTADFSWTPGFDDEGGYEVIFQVTDGTEEVADTIAITVTNTNRNPVFASVVPQEVVAEQELTFDVSATDPDGTTPALGTPILPSGADFTPHGDGTGSFSWTPTGAQVGPHTATFYATDGDLADTLVVDITVTATPTASVQLIHNVGDPLAAVVDIWVNGSVFVEDFAFRTATPFVQVPAGEELVVGVSPPDVPVVAASVTIPAPGLTAGMNYVAMAVGVVEPAGFEANPDGRDINFDVIIKENARTSAQSGTGLDFFGVHGATDAPTVDILARGVTTLVDNAAYGDQTAYQNVPAANYILDVTPFDDNATVVAAFEADLSALDGGAAVVFATGFLTPANDQNGEAFALAAALPDGSVIVFPPYLEVGVDPLLLNFEAILGGANPASQDLNITEAIGGAVDFTVAKSEAWLSLSAAGGTTPATVTASVDISGIVAIGEYKDTIVVTPAVGDPIKVPVLLHVVAAPPPPTASLQIIHNSADPATAIVDIWLNGKIFLEDVAYQSATPFMAVPAGVELAFAFTDPDSPTPVATFTITDPGLTQGVAYIAIASGVLTPGEFAPNPEARLIDFVLLIKEDAIVPSAKADVNLLFVHGVTDAGKVDIIARGVSTLVEDISYGDIAGYIQVAPGQYTIDVAQFDDPNIVFATFILDLAEKATDPVVALASGFAEPSLNQDGPPVTLLAVSGDGSTEVIPQECNTLLLSETLFEFTATEDEGGTSPTEGALAVTTTNPTSLTVTVAPSETATWLSFYDAGGDPTHVAELTGETPLDVGIVADPTGLGVGVYTAECTVTSLDDEACEPGVVAFDVSLTVEAPPSGDAVLVSKDAIRPPGAKVPVPVSIANDCPLASAFVALQLNADYLYVDSVSFVDGVFDGIATNSATINNETGVVEISSVVDSDLMETGGIWAILHVAISCDAPFDQYPINLAAAGGTNPEFQRDCGSGLESQEPFFEYGQVWVKDLPNYICGWVVDPQGVEIPGATVQLWGEFPVGDPWGETQSSGIGSFAFEGEMPIPFDLYAFAPGYYPTTERDLNFGDKGIKLVLTPLSEPAPFNPFHVVYYCGDNTYAGQPLPVGSVVEAWTSDQLLVGQFVVETPGSYGPMFVPRANEISEDPGAEAGEILTFTVNLLPAQTSDSTRYPEEFIDPIQVCLSAGDIVDKDCLLSEGWNLVSWNVDTDIDDIKTVLGPYLDKIDVVLGFDQGGLIYDPDLEEFSNLWDVDHLNGYWIRVKEGQGFTLNVTGLAVPVTTPIPVSTGWNLVSYLPDDTRAPEDALSSIMDILLYVYGWNTGIEIYSTVKPEFNTPGFMMMTCNGYWIKTSDDGTLVYSDDLPVLASNVLPNESVTTSRTSTPVALSLGVSATPQWVNLYSRDLKLNGEAVGAGVRITAHAEDGTMVGAVDTRAVGTFGFMPVYATTDREAEGLRTGESYYLAIDGRETNERFTWTGNGDRIEIASLSASGSSGGGELPEEYSLSQNYPNPFNPTTTISFTLASEGFAKVDIFNVLGKLVATPYEGVASSGEHTVVWDGRGNDGRPASSGVYFYRLTTENGFTASKKMMLLK
jgi:hypothetical protein